MNFKKREVSKLRIEIIAGNQHKVLDLSPDKNEEVRIYAHVDDDVQSQMFGIETVNRTTGEITTRRLNISVSDTYLVEMVEILETEAQEKQ